MPAKNDSRKRKVPNEKFNKEIRAYFKHGGRLDEGIKKEARGTNTGPQEGSQVYVDAIVPSQNKDECVCPIIKISTFLAKVVEEIKIADYVEFDKGIGNTDIINVDDDRYTFLFEMDGMYQIDIKVNIKEHGKHKLKILRFPAFEESLLPFTTFEADSINTLLPIHKGDRIRIKIKGVTILPGTQIRIIRTSDI